MDLSERREVVLENLVRLHRAERAHPEDRDIVAVKSFLERELGETVSQRLAAKLLGVSHTALARWIKRGDLPLIFDPSGRQAVPVGALLDLHESIEAQRAAGRRRRHLIEPTMIAARERADRISPPDLTPPEDRKGHSRADRRSLGYHRALAQHLRRSQANDAMHLVWKWREQGRIDPLYADRWESILCRPVSEIRKAIGEDSAAARDLRQNSPFAGALSEPERRKILEGIK